MVALLALLLPAHAQDAVACANGAGIPSAITCTHDSIAAAYAELPPNSVIHAYGSFDEPILQITKSMTISGRDTTNGVKAEWRGSRQAGVYWTIQDACGPTCTLTVEHINMDARGGSALSFQLGTAFVGTRVELYASGSPGGILAETAGSFTCVDCMLRDFSGLTALALVEGADVTWTRGRIERLSGDQGAIAQVQAGSVLFEGVQISEVDATTWGAVWLLGGSVTMRSTLVDASSADSAFFVLRGAGTSARIESSSFTNTEAAALVRAGTFDVPLATEVSLYRASVDGTGTAASGGVFSYGGSVISDDSTFTNLATGPALIAEGGAVATWTGGSISDSTRPNALVVVGPASEASLVGVDFARNDLQAVKDQGVVRTGVVQSHGVLTVDGCSFADNLANNGAAIVVGVGGNATIRNSLFQRNQATTSGLGRGGAVYLDRVALAELSGNRFFDNGAEWGGAIAATDGQVDLVGNLFCGNAATQEGGALYLGVLQGTSLPATPLALTSSNDVYLANDSAGGGGGLMLRSGSIAQLVHTTAWGNTSTASGSFAAAEHGSVDLVNSIVAAHTGPSALHSTASGPGTATGDYLQLWNNTQDGSGLATALTNTWSEDPQLGAMSLDGVCGNDDWRPLPTSPVIDRGDPTYGTDADGSSPDLGASGGQTAHVPDTTVPVDADGDGVDSDSDCDDGSAATYPGAPELCDAADNDCDNSIDEGLASTWYYDGDGDGQGGSLLTASDCAQPADHVANADDCDDSSAAVYLGAPEQCNETDDDCDGGVDEEAALATWYADSDGDDYGDASSPVEACTQPAGTVADATDCDDALGAVHPGATELCDEVDQDCDNRIDEGATSTWYTDSDGDGYAGIPVEACDPPTGSSASLEDCDEGSAAVHPGAAETCDGADEDCDAIVDEGVSERWYVDGDGDGYAGTAVDSCTEPANASTEATDCDDADGGVHPGADETCDAVDEDCDAAVDEDAVDAIEVYADADGDGWGSGEPVLACEGVAVAGDCDDADASVHPGATDLPNDGANQDCAAGEQRSYVGGASCASAPGPTGWLWLGLLALARRGRRA